jgi:thiol-disulfide isomerase/thioredoxin
MSRLDKVANIALILACALFIGHLARNYFTSQGADPNLQPDIKIGEVVSLPGSDTAEIRSAPVTLVMALSTHCSFCQASTPFYQKLSAIKNTSPVNVRLATVMPESKEEAEAYLKKYGVAADIVLSAPISKIGAKGTPTLLLLDRENRLVRSWVGQLNNSQESEIVSQLQKLCPQCSI